MIAPSSPRVTVIVPAYNAAGTLAETLDSAVGQSLRDLEVIVVDDGSTDATAEIAAAYQPKDARLRLIRTPNRGAAAARNTAIDLARGEFIAPLDADDLWHPDKLALQLKTFAGCSAGTGLVYNWFREINPSGFIIGGNATPNG